MQFAHSELLGLGLLERQLRHINFLRWNVWLNDWRLPYSDDTWSNDRLVYPLEGVGIEQGLRDFVLSFDHRCDGSLRGLVAEQRIGFSLRRLMQQFFILGGLVKGNLSDRLE